MSEPSIGEANKMLRVLNGTRHKMTVRLNLPDGKIIEWQADEAPKVQWTDDARGLWIVQPTPGYSIAPVMPWPEGAIMLCEENPKV